MKKNIVRYIIPIAIISFFVVTKWWYVLPEDATDSLFYGFPFPYYGLAWHTSLSMQVFVLEMVADFIFYILIWLVIFSIFFKFFQKIQIHKSFSVILWLVSLAFIGAFFWVGSTFEIVYEKKRWFEMEVLETEIKFIGQDIEKPDYYKYKPQNNIYK